jgi:hypothetical protein
VTVTTSTVLPIDITCVVTPQSGYSLDGTGGTIATRTAILTTLGNYLGLLGPGDEVVFEHIQACFFVPGVLDISGTVVNGITSGSIQLASGTQPQVARLGTMTFSEP